MKKRIFRLFIGLILLLIKSVTFSGEMADFMFKGAGARPLGMGGAFIAVSDDSNAILWNPAGLYKIKSWEFSSIRTILPDLDSTTDMLSLAYPISPKSAVAISYMSSITDDIIVAVYNEETQRFEISETSSFKERGLIFSYGHQISTQMSIGFNLKKYEHQFTYHSKSGWEADLSFLCKITENWNIGLSLQNIGWSKIGEDRIPTQVKFGTAFKLLNNKLFLAADINTRNSGKKSNLFYGLEYKVTEDLKLRMGSNKGDISYGVGIGFSNWGLDYSYLKEELSKNYRLSFKYNFGRIPKFPAIAEEKEKILFMPELTQITPPTIEVTALTENKIKIVAKDGVGNITTRILKLQIGD